jgi:hypothetical protein
MGPNSEVRARNWEVRFALTNGHGQPGLSGPFRARLGHRRREVAHKTSGYSDLRTDPKLIFGLRKPIAIHAEISLNMNLPE